MEDRLKSVSQELMDRGLRCRRSGTQEIKVTSLVGLRDALLIKRPVTPAVTGRGPDPTTAPQAQLLFRNQEVECTFFQVYLNQIAILHQCERPAYEAFGRDMQDARAIRSAAHS